MLNRLIKQTGFSSLETVPFNCHQTENNKTVAILIASFEYSFGGTIPHIEKHSWHNQKRDKYLLITQFGLGNKNIPSDEVRGPHSLCPPNCPIQSHQRYTNYQCHTTAIVPKWIQWISMISFIFILVLHSPNNNSLNGTFQIHYSTIKKAQMFEFDPIRYFDRS